MLRSDSPERVTFPSKTRPGLSRISLGGSGRPRAQTAQAKGTSSKSNPKRRYMSQSLVQARKQTQCYLTFCFVSSWTSSAT